MTRLRFAAVAAAVLILTGFVSASDDPGSRRHRIFFPDTDHELNVYDIRGREAGPTLLIIGGIHGNEPGGYLAADLYADLTLRRGNLIVVPRANIYSIVQNERGSRGDLNRKFGDQSAHDHEVDADIVGVLVDLMQEADALLNLHDGSGFYLPTHQDDLHNPLRWGQTVIIDTERLTLADGTRFDLASMADRAAEAANGNIPTEAHRFRVKNTRTYDDGSEHTEQRGSATFHAVNDIGIPAFGVETSKEIAEEVQRVGYQVLVINAFLEAFGIEPDHPRLALEPPELRYLTVSVDGAAPVVVENGGELAVPPGAELLIAHVEANYERGLIVDVAGLDGVNARRVPFRLQRDAQVVVRKDKYPCGEIRLRVDPAAGPSTSSGPPLEIAEQIEAFRIAVNGEQRLVSPGETLRVHHGDTLVLSDPIGTGDHSSYDVNLRGFVGNQVVNDGEDRGYQVHTEHDFLQRFSLSPERERYEVRAERGTDILATAVVEITAPRFQYLLARLDDGPRLALADGDTLTTTGATVLLLHEIVSDPREATGFQVNLRGYPGPEGAEDRGHPVDLRRDLLPAYSLAGGSRYYEIVVQIGAELVGRIVLDLGPPPPP